MKLKRKFDLQNMHIGECIQHLRVKNKLSLEALEILSGIPVRKLKAIEDLKMQCDLDTTYRLCQILKIDYQNAVILMIMSLIEESIWAAHLRKSVMTPPLPTVSLRQAGQPYHSLKGEREDNFK